jgi:TrmH family RNA methyltransferase
MGTAEWLAAQRRPVAADSVVTATEGDICRASRLQHPRAVMAVFRRPAWQQEEAEEAAASGAWLLALDGVQDPGNVGATVRTASWFGIPHVLCGRDTADIFNPKTLQASMGGIVNVGVHYCRLAETLRRLRGQGVAVYGTSTGGESVFAADTFAGGGGIVVLGNEGGGIREDTAAAVSRWVGIPRYGEGGVESLNVALSAAIVAATLRSPLTGGILQRHTGR